MGGAAACGMPDVVRRGGGSGCGPRVARDDVVGRLEDDGEVLPSTLTECAAGSGLARKLSMAKVQRRGKSGQSARQRRKARPSSKTALTRAAGAAGRVVGQTVATVAARVMPAGPHDPIERLERDHRRFEELFEKGEQTTERAARGRVALLQRLKAELRMHELMEEKVLYPALKPHARARDIVLEGYQEHHVADVLVKELERLPPSDERWGAKFKVLKENIEHHIEEEEGDMFRTARVVLTRHQLDSIGRRMEALKSRRKAG